MQLRHRVALAGRELDEIDDRIIIQGVQTRSAKSTQSAVSLYGANGQRLAVAQRDNIDIQVKFGILVRKTDMALRAELLDGVNLWAASALKEYGGAWLTLNYKPNRRMHVYLVEAAEEGDLKDWANTFTLTFRAYGVPYWQEVSAEAITTDVTTAKTALMTVNGSAQTVAEIELYNASGAQINTAGVSAGGRAMSFSGLAMLGGETLVIDHDDEGLLRIRIRAANGAYRSAYDKRMPNSANDLYVMPGVQPVSFTAQRACSMTAVARGRFL